MVVYCYFFISDMDLNIYKLKDGEIGRRIRRILGIVSFISRILVEF